MLQSGYCFTFSNNRFCYPIFKFWYEDHCFNEILLLLLFLLIRDHICIKLILTCGVYICSLNLWNYPFFLFYVHNVNFPRPLISSIVFCKLVLKNIEVLLLLLSEFLITAICINYQSLLYMTKVSFVASHWSFCQIIFIA